MTKLRQYDANIFAKEIYIVELVMEDGCCTDFSFDEPKFLGYPDSSYEIGFMVEQNNVSAKLIKVSLVIYI